MWGRSVVSADYNYNVVPFREILRFAGNIDKLGWLVVIINLAGNVAAFVPFGLFLPIVTNTRLNFWSVVILTFDLSLAIELMQLITRVGCFDVDDLILNVIGGMIGYGICCIFDKMERKHLNGVL
jgi:glycopeptide antibiotics resistance protein